MEEVMPAIGQEAPDFTLPSALHGQIGSVSLSQYRREKNVVLAFYVLDWTGT